jgi:hypothetical protein
MPVSEENVCSRDKADEVRTHRVQHVSIFHDLRVMMVSEPFASGVDVNKLERDAKCSNSYRYLCTYRGMVFSPTFSHFS